MSNEAAAAPDGLLHQASSGAGLTAGAILRAARERSGLHIGALAAALKVPVKKLEALESDRLEQLPDAVFARALAASVCRTLKLDPNPVLGLLPGQVKPRLQLDARVSGASFQTPHMGWRLPLLSRLSRTVVVTASSLVVAALALMFAPSLERLKPAPAKVPAATGPASGNAAPAVNEVRSVAVNTVLSPAAGSVVTATAPASAAAAPPATVAIEAAAKVAATTPVADPRVAQAGVAIFKTHGSSWVQVTDASGVVQLRKTMAAGETAAVSGALPLSVTVGRADATDVSVRGKPFDLAPLAKDNVARFLIH